jgi:hypothetical protein
MIRNRTFPGQNKKLSKEPTFSAEQKASFQKNHSKCLHIDVIFKLSEFEKKHDVAYGLILSMNTRC